MLGVHNVLLFFAYLGTISSYVIRERRLMLLVRAAGYSLFVFYFSYVGGIAGSLACGIAALGSFVQALVPDRLLSRTIWYRTGFALLLALAAIVLYAKTAGDMLPLLALINGRFAELSASPQRIRLGMIISQVLWIAYYGYQGFILLYVVEHIELLVNMFFLWRYQPYRNTQASVI